MTFLTPAALYIAAFALFWVGLNNCRNSAGKAGDELAFTAQAALGLAALFATALLQRAGVI
jgi:hypothetical protein